MKKYLLLITYIFSNTAFPEDRVDMTSTQFNAPTSRLINPDNSPIIHKPVLVNCTEKAERKIKAQEIEMPLSPLGKDLLNAFGDTLSVKGNEEIINISANRLANIMSHFGNGLNAEQLFKIINRNLISSNNVNTALVLPMLHLADFHSVMGESDSMEIFSPILADLNPWV